jgi:hypothetical protein
LRAVLFLGLDGSAARPFPRIIGSMSVDEGDQSDFPARYASMSDGELLKLAARSWELSEAAWEALEDELDRRRLDLPAPDPVPQVESPEKRNLVILRKFRDLPEALLAKGMLDSSGVPCFLADDNMIRLDWFISNLLGGVKILVDAEDFAEASRLLNEPAPQDFDQDLDREDVG